MEFKVEDFRVEPLKDGKFLKPYLAKFKLNGIPKRWELVKASDSVAILIYNKSSDSFILVKQFRPAVYFNQGDGVTIELCAGILDKDLTIEEIAAEEIFEETGFRVLPQELQPITSFYTAVGFAGSRQYLFYVEVEESQREGKGGGVEGEEIIEVIELPISKAKELVFDEDIKKTPGLMFAFFWFFSNHS